MFYGTLNVNIYRSANTKLIIYIFIHLSPLSTSNSKTSVLHALSRVLTNTSQFSHGKYIYGFQVCSRVCEFAASSELKKNTLFL